MRQSLLILFAALLALTALAQQANEQDVPQSKARDPLLLTYLANEGFLVEVGEHRLLFDGFLELPYAGYPALPSEVLSKLRKAEAPFAGIDLALASHVHGDHFQPAVARAFLLASPKTPFLTTPQAAAQLKETGDWSAELEAQVMARYPKSGKTEVVRVGDIQVTGLRLPHGGMPDIENLGTLVEIAGHTLLHLGDSATEAEAFEPYTRELAKVDLVLAPVWFFGTTSGRALLEKYLPAGARVAMHFAKKDQDKVVTSFLKSHPGVAAFARPLASKSFE